MYQVVLTLSYINLTGNPMNKTEKSRVSVGGWLGVAIGIASAISVAITANAHSQEHFEIERAGMDDAAAVVFIPGLATPGEVWADTVAALGDEVDAHILTVAGFGDVPSVGEGAFIAPVVDELTTYLRENGETDVTIVGHSMGAQIALQVAAAQPDLVSDVVVVDSAPFYARLFNPAISAEQAAQYGQGMAAQMSAMPRESFLAMSRQGLSIQSITETGQAQVFAWMERADQAAVARAMGEVMGSDYRPVLSEVAADVTILVAWSEGAPVSADQLRAMYADQYQDLQSHSIAIIADSRHFIMLDQPEAFRAALDAVLNTPARGTH